MNSRFGKTLISIKEDPVRAEFLGVNVKRYRLIAFIISGMFAGVAGGLSAPLTSIITADLASWTNSATPIIITLFGGYAYFLGPTVGAFIYEFFRYATASFSDASNLLIGLMLLIVILVLPKGVLGLIDIIRTKRTKLSKYKMEKNQKEVDKEVVVYDEGT